MKRQQRAALGAAALEADAKLERVHRIAQDLADGGRADRSPRSQMRRAGRRIMNLIEGVDEALGLDELGDDETPG